MAKEADRYLEVDPWAVVERGFHTDRTRVSESIFSLGNEYMGVRGYFEEPYSGSSLRGSYLNGVYEETPINHPQYFKGLAKRLCFMVNNVDWLHTRLGVDGEWLDLAVSDIRDFERRLDLRQGTLTRTFTWRTTTDKELRLTFIRFVSMVNANLGCLRLTLEPLNFSGAVEVETGLDFSIPYELEQQNFWHCPCSKALANGAAILGQTRSSGQQVFSAFAIQSAQALTPRLIQKEQFIGQHFTLALEQGQACSFDKLAVNHAERQAGVPSGKVWQQGMELFHALQGLGFDQALEAQTNYWSGVWNRLDITIEGDPENQQGIRFCIFQLHQTYHGVNSGLNVGAKGLTGESYYGWTFWDTETYCLPFYMFNNPAAARNLLGYRYHTLPQAIERAQQLDCRGARYPMGTIDGTESVGTWQHGDLEIHVSAAVSYGIWHYVHVTDDRDFLYSQGVEMLIEISRFFASRGGWSPYHGDFGFWGVMGADEFHMMVHNNVYTNLMAKKTFEWTQATIAEMKTTAPEALSAAIAKTNLQPTELVDWSHMAEKMRINYDSATRLFEQHDGYFDMPHVDVRQIPPRQFPIYKHWAYDSIFRVNAIKQPDVLLFLFFFSHEYALDVKQANYEFYEARCSHESSLSPSIHSIMAAELGKHAEAYQYALHAARLDLDNYNRNTHEGLHTTSMAAAWLNMVYGFGGLRSDGDVLSLNPSLPKNWQAFTFRLLYRGSLLQVKVSRDSISMQTVEGAAVALDVFGQRCEVGAEPVSVPLPDERRANHDQA
jgi:maltose phosphorylase